MNWLKLKFVFKLRKAYLNEIDVHVIRFVQPIRTDEFAVELWFGNVLTTGRGRSYLIVSDIISIFIELFVNE